MACPCRGLVLLSMAALLLLCSRPAAANAAMGPERNYKGGGQASLQLLDMVRFPMARCLDGSPGAFYVWPATVAEDSGKWVVYHEGGAWCSMDVPLHEFAATDHCAHRSTTDMGSSLKYPQEVPAGWAYWGTEEMLSEDPHINPLMHSWNKVALVYCDGGSFSGRREQPYVSQGQPDLFFRGHFVLEAIIETLLFDHGLQSATDLVVSGRSAGGLATILHADMWAERLRAAASPAAPPPFVVALPESGFFLDWDLGKSPRESLRYNTQMRGDFTTFNASTVRGCEQARRDVLGDVSDCFLAEHALPFVQTPTFILQSVVDSWQLGFVLGESSDSVTVNAFRESATSRLLEQFNTKRGSGGLLGGFVDSCVHHCGLWDELQIEGVRKADAFSQWFWARKQKNASAQSLWWQASAFPCPECCGGSTQPKVHHVGVPGARSASAVELESVVFM